MSLPDPETSAVATRVSSEKVSSKSAELDIVNGSLCNFCALAFMLALY